MPISENPRRNTKVDNSLKAEAFIAKAGTQASAMNAESGKAKPIMLRIPTHILERIDREAKRLGIARTAFIVQSAVRELDRTEGGR